MLHVDANKFLGRVKIGRKHDCHVFGGNAQDDVHLIRCLRFWETDCLLVCFVEIIARVLELLQSLEM